MKTVRSFDYRYQGQHLRSFVALQALEGSELFDHAAAEPDLNVLLGLPERCRQLERNAAGWRVGEGSFALDVPDVGRLSVLDGREIHISALPAGQETYVEQLLLGSAFAVAQAQRRQFCLHAAVLTRGGRTVAFCGDSGEGKSTLAMALSAAGWQALTDDLALMQPRDGVITVQNNGRHLRLWGESLAALGYSSDGLAQVSPHELKYYVRAPNPAEMSGARLDAICFLESVEPGDAFALVPVSGMPALAALRRHTYRPELIAALGCEAPHLAHCCAVLGAAPLYRFQRPRALGRIAEMVAFVGRQWPV